MTPPPPSAARAGLRIAFYAPLKPPGHPVPSGDRAMARLFMAALERAGHEVRLASDLRAYLPDPGDREAWSRLAAAAATERDRLAAAWHREGPPDLWFCYHPYYKSPDLIGPPLARLFGRPWVSAEASLSARRGQGFWADSQAAMAAAVAGAAVNIGLTARDRAGLAAMAPGARLAALAPFLGAEGLPPAARGAGLVTVAMMRPGDKMASYRALAAAMADLPGTTLTVVGGGPMAGEVRAILPAGTRWRGELPPGQVAGVLAEGAVYLWPGIGEAFGLGYLEAQAVGLPVVAYATAGVPEVVENGMTGFLVAPGDTAGLAAAAARLLTDDGLRRRMAAAARARMAARHLLPAASRRLAAILAAAVPAGGAGR